MGNSRGKEIALYKPVILLLYWLPFLRKGSLAEYPTTMLGPL